MQIKALCCDRFLEDLLRGNHEGQVLGVYQQSFHVLLEDGRLVTLFGGIRSRMPMSVCTTAPAVRPFRKAALAPGMKAVVCHGVLRIPDADFLCVLGGELVDFYRQPLPIPQDTDVLEAALRKAGKRNGAGQFLEEWLSYLEDRMPLPEQAAVPKRIAALLDAVGKDPAAVRQALMESVGLGIGLTPSADDMICGLAAAAWLYWKDEAKTRFLRELDSFCRSRGTQRTTLLSCQQMLLTARGMLSDPVYRLAESLSCGGENQIMWNAVSVIDYGSSSGTELCMGFLAGVQKAIEYCKNERDHKW